MSWVRTIPRTMPAKSVPFPGSLTIYRRGLATINIPSTWRFQTGCFPEKVSITRNPALPIGRATQTMFFWTSAFGGRISQRDVGVLGDGLAAGAHVQLFVNAPDVGVDGPHAYVQLASDLLV